MLSITSASAEFYTPTLFTKWSLFTELKPSGVIMAVDCGELAHQQKQWKSTKVG